MHVLTSTMMLPPAKPKICAAPNKSMKTHYIYTFLYYVFSIMTRWYFHVISRFFGTMASQFKCPLLKASTDTQTWKRWCRIFQFTTKFLPETIDHFQTTTSNRNRRLRMKGENLWTCHWNLKTKVPFCKSIQVYKGNHMKKGHLYDSH